MTILGNSWALCILMYWKVIHKLFLEDEILVISIKYINKLISFHIPYWKLNSMTFLILQIKCEVLTNFRNWLQDIGTLFSLHTVTSLLRLGEYGQCVLSLLPREETKLNLQLRFQTNIKIIFTFIFQFPVPPFLWVINHTEPCGE